MNLESVERLRSVGHLERYSTARHSLGFYTNVAVSAEYIVPVAQDPGLKDLVYRACGSLISEHPALSAVPIDVDTNQPYFVRLPEIDLEKSIFFSERDDLLTDDEATSDLAEFLQSEHDTPFTAGLHYWRLHIFTNRHDKGRFTAVFVYHHAIGDGSSGKAFHATFLRAFTNASCLASENTMTVVKPPNTPLLPPLEELHPLRLSWFYILKVIFAAKVWAPQEPQVWTGEKISLPLKTKVHHAVLSKADTTALKNICRKNDTTITATFQTLMAKALFAHAADMYTKVCCCGAISTRRWFSGSAVTDDSIGVWVLDFTEHYTRDALTKADTFPWSEAQRSRRTIETFLQGRGKNTNVGLLKLIKNYHQDLLNVMLGKTRPIGIEVSNIGVLKVEDRVQDSAGMKRESPESAVAKPRIGRMTFSQSGNVSGPALNISVLTGGDGCLVYTFCWQEIAVKLELVTLVIEEMKKDIDLILAETNQEAVGTA